MDWHEIQSLVPGHVKYVDGSATYPASQSLEPLCSKALGKGLVSETTWMWNEGEQPLSSTNVQWSVESFAGFEVVSRLHGFGSMGANYHDDAGSRSRERWLQVPVCTCPQCFSHPHSSVDLQ